MLIEIGAPIRTTLSTISAVVKNVFKTRLESKDNTIYMRNERCIPFFSVSARAFRHLKTTRAPSEKPTRVTGLKPKQADVKV